jgi:6-phosphogluconate dehydrogenase (decarboxylating)
MTKAKNEYGVVGLGRMGGNLSRQALEKGIRWSASRATSPRRT